MATYFGNKLSPTCPNCFQKFNFNDAYRPQGPKMPILLDCSHVFCEGCLRSIAKNNKNILCSLCQKATDLPEGENSIKNFPFDVFVLGLLIANRTRSNQEMLKLSLVPAVKSYDLKAEKTLQDLCEECARFVVAVKCEKCDCYYCKACFEKIHKAFKSMKKHKPIAIKEKISSYSSLCVTHNRHIEFYCQDDNSPACSYCVAMGEHKGHNIQSIEEKNELFFPKLKSVIHEASGVIKCLDESQKKIVSLIPEIKAKGLDLSLIVRNHFGLLHSILQKREAELLKQIEESVLLEIEPYEHMKEIISSQISYLNTAITDAEKLLRNPNNNCGTVELVEKLERAKYLPCHLLPKDEIDNQPQEKENGFDVDEDFTSRLLTYGNIGFASNQRYVLKINKEITFEKYSDEASIQCSDRLSFVGALSRSISECTDDIVNETESETSSCISQLSEEFPKIQVLPKRNGAFLHLEKVIVTHIKHPCHFVVQRYSDAEQLETLSKNMLRWCRSNDANLSIPSQPIEGIIYLGQFGGDNNWYRARVNKIIPDEDSNSPDIKVDVTYIDYGNGEILPSYKLREIPRKFLKLPEMALVCSLYGISSKQDNGWSEEAVCEFARMIGDKTVLMTVIRQEASMLYVDLLQNFYEDVCDDNPVSIRDALVFLEVANFIASSINLPNINPSRRKFMKPKPLIKNDKLKVTVTSFFSPDNFCVQLTNDGTSYLSNMMVAMQNAYNSEKSNCWMIYSPYKDMACACYCLTDMKWYRAKILELPGNRMVRVIYVDFGNTELVYHLNLRFLIDEFMKIPPQAFNFCLADIEPKNEDNWHEQANSAFLSLVMERSLVAVITSIEEEISKVILYDSYNTSLSINAQLVHLNYAKSTGSGSKAVALDLDENCLQESEMAIVPEKSLNVFKHPLLESDKILTSSPATNPVIKKIICLQKASGRPVRISYFESPSNFYIQIVSAEDFNLDKFMKKLKSYYDFTEVAAIEWKVGDSCCARSHQENKWYRAEILKLAEGQSVEVFMLDYGFKELVIYNDLRPLKKEYRHQSVYAMRCHLAHIIPAGGKEHWPQVACEFFKDLMKEHDHFHIKKLATEAINNSLPVDLLIEKLIPRGALEGSSVEVIGVSEQLIASGLALPQRIFHENSVNFVDIPVEKVIYDKKSDSIASSNNENEVNFPSHDQNENLDMEITNSFDRFITIKSEEALEKRLKPKPHDLLYLPPIVPESMVFMAIPTFISSDGLVCLQACECKKSLTFIMNALLSQHLNTDIIEKDEEWHVGELCTVLYQTDKLWYRGLVTDIKGNNIEVLYVDFGNKEIVQKNCLVKKALHCEIPQQCLTCKIHNVKPLSMDGNWPVDVIQMLSELLIGQLCQVEIVTPGEILEVRIILPETMDLATFLITKELCTSITWDEDEWKSDCLYSFSESLSIDWDIPFPVIVPHLHSPIQLSIQRKHFSNPDDDLKKEFNFELDLFAKTTLAIQEYVSLWPALENPTAECCCCAYYSGDSSWYRGQILSVKDNAAEVLFVDFGNSEFVPFSSLKVLPRKYTVLPKQAVRCHIANLVPVDSSWSDTAMDFMANLLTNVILWAVIKKVEPNIEVELYDKNPSEPNSQLIYQPLIDQGFALLDQ